MNKTLLDAADLLKRSKWWRPGPTIFEEDRPEGWHCVLTAINAVADTGVAVSTARQRLRTILNLREAGELARWNDKIAKSKAEVIRTMREAAKQ